MNILERYKQATEPGASANIPPSRAIQSLQAPSRPPLPLATEPVSNSVGIDKATGGIHWNGDKMTGGLSGFSRFLHGSMGNEASVTAGPRAQLHRSAVQQGYPTGTYSPAAGWSLLRGRLGGAGLQNIDVRPGQTNGDDTSYNHEEAYPLGVLRYAPQGHPLLGSSVPSLLNHELGHAAQADTPWRPKFPSPEYDQQEMQRNTMEIGPSVGDLVFNGEEANRVLGKPLQHTVQFPNGQARDIQTMIGQAREHGYFGQNGQPGVSMDQLLGGNTAGQQWLGQVAGPALPPAAPLPPDLPLDGPMVKRNSFVDTAGQGLKSLAEGIKFHLPQQLRLPDSMVGGAAGVGLGAAAYGTNHLLHRDEKDPKRHRSLLKDMAIGGGLGVAAGNVLGDRTRRFAANRLVPLGYGTYDNSQALKPDGWKDFWDSAIADKPKDLSAQMGQDFNIDGRRELLRRGMGLPVNSGKAPILRPIGNVDFKPTPWSGGLPGKFPAVEYAPKSYNAEMAAEDPTQPLATDDLRDQLRWLHRGYASIYPHTDGPVPNRDYKPFSPLLADHNTEFNHQNQTARVSDLWDFALDSENEHKGLKNYAREAVKQLWQHKAPYGEILTGLKKDPRSALLQRVVLNNLLMKNRGIVFQQDFNMAGEQPQPIFHGKQGSILERYAVD